MRHPFYIGDNLVRCHPVLPVLIGRKIPNGICNTYTAHHTSFFMFALYVVKTSNDLYGIQYVNRQYSVKYEVSI